MFLRAPDPEIRCRDFFNARSPEVSTHSPGAVFHPESFFDGPEAWRGPLAKKLRLDFFNTLDLWGGFACALLCSGQRWPVPRAAGREGAAGRGGGAGVAAGALTRPGAEREGSPGLQVLEDVMGTSSMTDRRRRLYAFLEADVQNIQVLTEALFSYASAQAVAAEALGGGRKRDVTEVRAASGLLRRTVVDISIVIRDVWGDERQDRFADQLPDLNKLLEKF
ncbi:unnamed protein product [Prorocentrum cordatum]|uniref:Uncharacterized protein n=1 Tax=Prorocentrum cordatum TaxID=2364126 RepID=A0ABN9R653_9DINO|nr:unnamed protein product [Polarella glacialis]